MNLNTVLVSDLVDNYYMRNRAAVLSNGKLVGFLYEKDAPIIACKNRAFNDKTRE